MMYARVLLVNLSVLLSPILVQSSVAADLVIDWSVCSQPNRTSEAYVKQQTSQINTYVKSAQTKFPSEHIAVALNKYYGEIVQQRRDFVVKSYIPISAARLATACALSAENYTRLLIMRDASYYVLCRAEVAIGRSRTARLANDLKSLAYAAIYDFLKTAGVDMRAKANEPTTPPGGYAGCSRGVDDGQHDPFPTEAQAAGFKTRLSVPDSEKKKIGDPTQQ